MPKSAQSGRSSNPARPGNPTRPRKPAKRIRSGNPARPGRSDLSGKDPAQSAQPAESVPHPLPEPLIELVAQRFRVLGEPMRIKLLDRLRDGQATVGELQQALGASQQNVSKHLGILHAAGMVSRSKDGNHTRYAIGDPAIFDLCDQVCGGVRRQVQELDAVLGSRWVARPARPRARRSLAGTTKRARHRRKPAGTGPA